jgi:hypothetical protein
MEILIDTFDNNKAKNGSNQQKLYKTDFYK